MTTIDLEKFSGEHLFISPKKGPVHIIQSGPDYTGLTLCNYRLRSASFKGAEQHTKTDDMLLCTFCHDILEKQT